VSNGDHFNDDNSLILSIEYSTWASGHLMINRLFGFI